MSVGLKWKLVLKSHHALKKPCIHGKLEFIMQLKASCPHFRIWALFLLSIPKEMLHRVRTLSSREELLPQHFPPSWPGGVRQTMDKERL